MSAFEMGGTSSQHNQDKVTSSKHLGQEIDCVQGTSCLHNIWAKEQLHI